MCGITAARTLTFCHIAGLNRKTDGKKTAFFQLLSNEVLAQHEKFDNANIESAIPTREIFMPQGQQGAANNISLPDLIFTFLLCSSDYLSLLLIICCMLSLINPLTKDSTCPPCCKNKCVKLNRLKFERVLTLYKFDIIALLII